MAKAKKKFYTFPDIAKLCDLSPSVLAEILYDWQVVWRNKNGWKLRQEYMGKGLTDETYKHSIHWTENGKDFVLGLIK